MELQERFHEIVSGGQDRGCQHQHHHDLPGGIAHTYQHMAQQAKIRILIVGPDLKGL